MPSTVKCEHCGVTYQVAPYREKATRFCSVSCRAEWRKTNFTGPNHPRWTGGSREKVCEGCGMKYTPRANQPITTFKSQKFCSRVCADKYGVRLSGESHPNYNPASRRRNRRGKHGAWARAVISRDKAICQQCGATNVELHAHHIKFSEYPELRWDLENGVTLCVHCHWAVHAALNANGVNSGNLLAGGAEENPEPSFGRKPIEGVTTRGRAYRRWNGKCDWCSAFISKRWSDAKGKAHLFCSRSCASKHNVANGKAFGRSRQ